MEIENRMVSGLSESEREELVRLLRKLTRAMRGQARNPNAYRNMRSQSSCLRPSIQNECEVSPQRCP